jgi:hypothetical protein
VPAPLLPPLPAPLLPPLPGPLLPPVPAPLLPPLLPPVPLPELPPFPLDACSPATQPREARTTKLAPPMTARTSSTFDFDIPDTSFSGGVSGC